MELHYRLYPYPDKSPKNCKRNAAPITHCIVWRRSSRRPAAGKRIAMVITIKVECIADATPRAVTSTLESFSNFLWIFAGMDLAEAETKPNVLDLDVNKVCGLKPVKAADAVLVSFCGLPASDKNVMICASCSPCWDRTWCKRFIWISQMETS